MGFNSGFKGLKGSGEKSARKKSLGKPRRRWKTNIKKCHPVKDG